MKTLHFDCFSGAAGDMIVGALVDLGVDRGAVRAALDGLGVPGLKVTFRRVRRGGLAATQFRVAAPGRQPHRGLREIRRLLRTSDLTTGCRQRAEAIFRRLCEAEAKLHGVPVSRVHLHEVGAVDSIADVVGAAFCLEQLAPRRITASSLATGSGTVDCEHGTLPVPAPATLELLRGAPVHAGPATGELLTPTGAAILTTVVDAFGPLPRMTVERIGLGAGSREHSGVPNVLRAVEGRAGGGEEDAPEVLVLEANIDDMNPQNYGHVMDLLFQAGARDVFLTPVLMKKNRPGVLLTVVAREASLASLGDVLLRETTSIGLRYHRALRRELERETLRVRTRFGLVGLKVARLEGRPVQVSPEYEDCRRLALRHGLPLDTIREEALRTYRSSQGEE